MKRVHVHSKDGDLISTYTLNTIQAIDFVSSLLSGTDNIIMIFNAED